MVAAVASEGTDAYFEACKACAGYGIGILAIADACHCLQLRVLYVRLLVLPFRRRARLLVA